METELNNKKDKYKYLKITTVICLMAVALSFAGCGADGKGGSSSGPSSASGTTIINCVKIRNLVKVKELHETITPGKTSIYDLKLPYFLQGQIIYAWDAAKTKQELAQLFGSGIEFNIYDLREHVSQVIPSVKNLTT